jgi:hypothetical protein
MQTLNCMAASSSAAHTLDADDITFQISNPGPIQPSESLALFAIHIRTTLAINLLLLQQCYCLGSL